MPFEDCWSNHERSRLLKTNLRNIVEGDFLFIDTDTVIVGSLSDIDDCEYNIACVPDKHVPISQHSHRANIDNGARILGWHVDDDLKYYNSGVVFVRDNDFTHKFLNCQPKNVFLYTHSVRIIHHRTNLLSLHPLWLSRQRTAQTR